MLLLLITTRNVEEIKNQCREKLKLTEKQTQDVLEKASGQITEVAAWNRNIEVGKAIWRADDIYERALRVQDNKTALASETHRCKLLGLYEKDENVTSKIEWLEEIEIVRSYLEPLELAAPGVALPELARLTADKVIDLMSNEYAGSELREKKEAIERTECGSIESGSRDRPIAAGEEPEAEDWDEEQLA